MIFYILFLGLFSFVLLVDYFPLNIYNEYQSEIQILPISITEIILHICFWSFIIEEIRQFPHLFLGYSISSWSLITTDNQISWNYNSNRSITGDRSGLWTWQLLHDITNFGVWKIFGQILLFSLDGINAYSIVTFILTILFVVISSVLLLNVLVALFNITIENVQMQSHRIWSYQRFLLVYEYNNKPPLPPPFNTIYYLYSIIRYIIEKIQYYHQKCQHVACEISKDSIDSSETEVREEFKISNAMQHESAIADDYWSYILKHGKKDPVEAAIENIERKLHDLQEQMHDMMNHGLN
ncbi:unnamed protein product [Rotaria sordida]|uniref:Ion transport domain-containing protein n=1 Tax=Rotaria sordida TaxID=392033 RepID=A0A814KH62_9BILA|nr:unnamed protein product [Rotaria sordida]CAF1347114.1 unnamed protein product [Rotaria sordida]